LQELNINYRKGYTIFKSDSLKNILKNRIKKVLGYNIMNI